VVVENLVKRCGDVVALDVVSFSVAGGVGAQRGGEDHHHQDLDQRNAADVRQGLDGGFRRG